MLKKLSHAHPLYDHGLVWFRRDLRMDDHGALYHALKSCRKVWCVFVFDREILDALLQHVLKADHLSDFDLAANNGSGQWAASTGCDAQPWFRIFNPVSQAEKFDPEGRFIKRYLPAVAGLRLYF